MRKSIAVLLTCILMPACLAACVTLPAQPAEPNTTDIPPVNMPNPASVYCEENGNQLEILTADDGSQSGLCVFPDGSTCDEWAYFRGECGPSAQILPTASISDEGTQKENDEKKFNELKF